MKKTIQILFLFSFINTFSQYNSVPFREGNLFGISDAKGKIILKPQFDIIEVSSYDILYFTGFNLNGKTITSSLIYNNKIILNNKDYDSYNCENELFEATKYIVNPRVSNFSDDKVKNIVHLYDKNGKAIIAEDCNYIGILENSDEKKISNEVLVYYQNADQKSSLFLYNKKLNKITNYYFQNSYFLEIDTNSSNDYRDKSITFTYVDQNNKGKKLTVLQESKGVKKIEEIDFEIKKNNDYEHDFYNDVVAIPEGDYYEKKPVITSNDSIIDVMGNVEIAREFYYNPKKIEQIKVVPKKLSLDWSHIIKKNDKVGLKLTKDNKIIIPIAYDEILSTELGGLNSCYLVKQNNKYGAQIYAYNEKERFEIAPVFKGKFLIADLDYFGDKNPLLKIYDENGLFYCYAKKDGTLFMK
jgi:hypothetical protein